jgi:magnesium-transporting ATPase (P-type)
VYKRQDLFLLKDKRNKREKEKILNFWENKTKELSKKGLKLIMVGVENLKDKSFEIKGIIALKDKIRENVKEIIKELSKNNIKLKVLTGDKKGTTEYVLQKIGVKGKVIGRKELIKMDDKQLLEELEKITAFTELLPEDKSRIIKVAKQRYGVGMLGDGVNDSLALKKANVSLVVGNGSDLAKGVADIVLLKNNLEKIKDLIFEGRNVLYTIKKLVLYMAPTNVVELIVGSVGVFIKQTLLKPVQILWINLVTDSLPSFLFFNTKIKGLKKEEVFPLLNEKDKKFIIVSSFFFLTFVALLFLKIRKDLMLIIITWELLHYFFLKHYLGDEADMAKHIKVLTFIFFLQYFILIKLKVYSRL